VLASTAPVEPLSITQLNTTAHTLPGIVHAVGQPDLHPGTKFPIGAVFASRGWVHPPLIGGDIGCGMAWYKTTLSRSQLEGDKGKKAAEKLRGLEGPWRTQAHREAWLKEAHGSCSAGEEWDMSLGSIGAGNHFAEIQVVEASSLAGDSKTGLRPDDVVLLVHSGSRGFGGSILKRFTTESRTSFREHDKACQWAKANRDLIALRFLSCLEPGNEAWNLGVSHTGKGDADGAVVAQARETLQERKVVDIWHNNIERVKWPPAPPSSISEGASPASKLLEGTRNLTIGDTSPQ
jgi:RNA-splicing ligase RtcB